MNVIDSTESTDIMTLINNEQSIILLSIVIMYFVKFVAYCIKSDTKTLDYMEINCSVLNSFS